MAGNYPDVPSWRMAYDRDGTQVYKIDSSNVITQLNSSEIVLMNDEDDDYYNVGGGIQTLLRVAFVFPELRDLDAYFVALAATVDDGFKIEVSANTTNGLDGTWTTIFSVAADVNYGGALVNPNYRTDITSSTQAGIRSIRFSVGTGSGRNFGTGFLISAIHLYGKIATGQNPDRLALWHPTLDQRLSAAYFDWNDIPRGTTATKTFRVKNLSSTLNANTPRVAMETITDGSPSVPGWHALSLDGSTWLSQVNPGTLAPGAISGVVTLRRIVPTNAQLSVWAFRVFAEATSWS